MQLALRYDRAPETLQERFEDYHRRNPQVYAELLRLAMEAKARGLERIGIATLYETVRWELAIRAAEKNDAGPRMNNDYRSRYARLIMDNEPDLREFFEVRRLTTE